MFFVLAVVDVFEGSLLVLLEEEKGTHLRVMACHSSSLFLVVLSDLVLVEEEESTSVELLELVPLLFSANARATILYRLDSSFDCTMPNMVRRLASRSLSPVAARKNSFPVVK